MTHILAAFPRRARLSVDRSFAARPWPMMLLPTVAFLLILANIAHAQCAPQWLPFAPLPVTKGGTVYASTVWDPDGDGPLPPWLVVAGSFSVGGQTPANFVAAWDGSSWRGLPGFELGELRALAVYNGELIVGGSVIFLNGAATLDGVFRWDGATWQPLGSAAHFSGVRCLTTYRGELIAGGEFGNPTSPPWNIASWNGDYWRPLGSGVNSRVYGLAEYRGELVAAGHFTTAGGVPASLIARWDGQSWRALGSGLSGDQNFATSLTVYNDDLIVVGSFLTAGGQEADHVAAWNGESWHPIGSGLNHNARAVIVYYGDLIAGGEFVLANGHGGTTMSITRWDGVSWQPMDAGMSGGSWPYIFSFATYNHDLIATGEFGLAGGIPAFGVGRWGKPGLCPADTDCNGFVDGADSDLFNNLFETGDSAADYNGDGFVDGLDSDQFNNDFETGC